jgi:fibronectin-binding autotransporter adhesin
VLDLNGFSNAIGSLSGSGTVTNNDAAPVILTAGGDNTTTTFGGVLSDGSGTLGLTKTGLGTMIITGTNTYTGGTTITGGALQIGNGSTTGSIVGNVIDDAVLLFDRSGTFALSSSISGTGMVTQQGTGTVELMGNNTYSGPTTVTSGTLQAGSLKAFSATSAYTVAVSSVLDLNGFSNMIGSLSGSGTVTNNGAGPAVLTAGGDDTTKTFDGVLSDGPGTLGLTKTGLGTLILTGTNTYTGGTTVTGGTLQIGNGGTMGSIVGNVTDDATLAFD